MRIKGIKVLSYVTFFVSTLAFFQIQAAASLPCGAEASVGAFVEAAETALAQLPRLDANVDKCFPKYREETREVLRSVQATYQKSLNNLESAVDGLQRGQDATFVAAIPKIVAAVYSVNKPVFSQANNLTNYGFTTSDRRVGGRYKYPQCNSEVNDNPEENWAITYSAITAIHKAGKALLATAKCLQ